MICLFCDKTENILSLKSPLACTIVNRYRKGNGKAMKEFKKTDPEFYQTITDFVYDEAYHACALDETEKYICILAGLMGV